MRWRYFPTRNTLPSLWRPRHPRPCPLPRCGIEGSRVAPLQQWWPCFRWDVLYYGYILMDGLRRGHAVCMDWRRCCLCTLFYLHCACIVCLPPPSFCSAHNFSTSGCKGACKCIATKNNFRLRGCKHINSMPMHKQGFKSLIFLPQHSLSQMQRARPISRLQRQQLARATIWEQPGRCDSTSERWPCKMWRWYSGTSSSKIPSPHEAGQTLPWGRPRWDINTTSFAPYAKVIIRWGMALWKTFAIPPKNLGQAVLDCWDSCIDSLDVNNNVTCHLWVNKQRWEQNNSPACSWWFCHP